MQRSEHYIHNFIVTPRVSEVWETRTYCCTEDGCNHAVGLSAPATAGLIAVVVAVVMASSSAAIGRIVGLSSPQQNSVW